MMPKRISHKIFTKTSLRRLFARILGFLGVGFLLFIITGLSLFIYYIKDLPRPEKFTEKALIQSTKIYDRTGEILLYEMYGEEKREIVPLDQIPETLIKAILAAEDVNFYKHFGIDFRGIVRATLANLQIMQPSQGGSTISQQLIRSSLLTREKTLERKVREIILTLELERQYSKEQILELYL